MITDNNIWKKKMNYNQKKLSKWITNQLRPGYKNSQTTKQI